jgi:Nuclease-related domain
MAANRYAEMVRWMAWPRIKNSRSSAQPGTHPHDGVQATVTPAPDAEPPPASRQNTGIGGTTHAVACEPPRTANGSQRVGRRLRPIRYAHAGITEPKAPTEPVELVSPPPGASPPTAAYPAAPPPTGARNPEFPPPPGASFTGTVSPGPSSADEPKSYDGATGLVYRAPRAGDSEMSAEEPDGPVRNEGLGIFGGVATTEVPDESAPTRPFEHRPPQPPPSEPEPRRVIPVGAAWNQPIAPPPVASSGPQERKQNPFGRIRGTRAAGGQPPDDSPPRVSVRDLPPDVQLRFIRDRVIIVLVVGVVSFIFLRSWPVSLTLVIIAWVLDTIRRSRSAVLYVNGGAHPGARKATTKQLRKMQREGYFTLDARPIPDSREVIDHLVIGPTGVYAIDSEKWDPKLPIRTWNGKKLYHGPESQKDRLEHAVWEAAQASEILSGALGTEIKVKPALAIYGPRIPWDMATIRNVDVFTGPALGKYLKARRRKKDDVPRLTAAEVTKIYDTAVRLLPDVKTEGAYTPVG